jgi:cob(I)alamin adenosyltransferase
MGRIWTGGGDMGETSLGDGSRVDKDDPRVEAYGTLDEAASAIGFARVLAGEPPLDLLLAFAQQRLMSLAALLASPDAAVAAPSEGDIAALERSTDDLLQMASGFTGFTLPGGSELGARLHLARTVVRRAERRMVTLARAEGVDAAAMRFVNRLSDALYAAARYANSRANVGEQRWDAGFPTPGD